METFAIISLVLAAALSVGGTIGTIFSNKELNQAQLDYAREAREDAQAFEAEQAQLANAAGLEMFYKTQSPQARMDMLKNAGLNPGLIYSGNGMQGGASAGAKAVGTAGPQPNMLPLFDGSLLKTLSETLSNTSNTIINKQNADTNENIANSQIEVNKSTIDLIDAEIEQTMTTIEKIEAETQTEFVTKALKEKETLLKENEVIEANATLNTRINTADQFYKNLQKTYEEIEARVDLMNIEKKYKDDILKETKKNLQALTAKYWSEKGLADAQKLVAKAEEALKRKQADLTDEQKKLYSQQIKEAKAATQKITDEINKGRWEENHYWEIIFANSNSPWGIISSFATGVYMEIVGNRAPYSYDIYKNE